METHVQQSVQYGFEMTVCGLFTHAVLRGFHASVANNDLRGIEHAEAELCFHTLQGGKW